MGTWAPVPGELPGTRPSASRVLLIACRLPPPIEPAAPNATLAGSWAAGRCHAFARCGWHTQHRTEAKDRHGSGYTPGFFGPGLIGGLSRLRQGAGRSG